MDDTVIDGWYPDPHDPTQYRYWDGEQWTEDRIPRSQQYPKAERGWHSDPTGRHELRFYDGNAWTDFVSDDGAPSVDAFAAESQVVAVSREETPGLRSTSVVSASIGGYLQQHWKIVGIVSGALVLLGAAVLLAATSGRHANDYYGPPGSTPVNSTPRSATGGGSGAVATRLVPNIVGLPMDAARSVGANAGFAASLSGNPDPLHIPDTACIVISQSPRAGELVPQYVGTMGGSVRC